MCYVCKSVWTKSFRCQGSNMHPKLSMLLVASQDKHINTCMYNEFNYHYVQQAKHNMLKDWKQLDVQ
jgi:hypothetical protein